MTGLEKILEQINLDAKEATREQLQQAQEQVDALLDATNAEIEKQRAQHLADLASQEQSMLSRAQSSAELTSRKQLLATKQHLINQTIEQAKQTLCDLPDEQYFAVLLKLADKYQNGQSATMALSARDLKRLPNGFATKLPKEITIRPEPANIQNGFLLIFDGIDINCSFDALFSDKTEELQDKTASILFS